MARSHITIGIAVLAAMALAPGVARADHDGYWGHEHRWHERYWRPPVVVVGPGYYAPPPVMYAPPPVIYAPPPPVVYAPPPVVYAAPPVVVGPPVVSLGINIPLR